jgi:hypothetical protein
MNKRQTKVKFFHVGDGDYNGTVLHVAESKKQALEYVKEWLYSHSTKTYTFSKVSNDRWESKFSAIYLEN